MNTVSKNLHPADWRRQRGLTKAGAARLLGVTDKNPTARWKKWETGEREPPLRVISELERISNGAVSTASWIAVRKEYAERRRAA